MAERRVTARMLDAGRAAFLEKRSLLDDLYDYYPEDLRDFLAAIYKAMDAERWAGDARVSPVNRG